MTSHDVVQRVRRALRQRRVGHAGTLDPAATGVLVILAGRATRLSQFLTAADKEYEGRLVLGSSTDTQDADGVVVATGDFSGVTAEQLREVFGAFTGDIMQVPPMVSAVKQDGRRLYELARRGVEVEREARPVTVRRFELLGLELPDAQFRVTCSKGTYVRTLVADVGDRLGCGAHLGGLRRTRSGDFALGEAIALSDFERSTPRERLPGRSLLDALADLPVLALSEKQLDQVLEGQAVGADVDAVSPVGTLVRLTGDGTHLAALARVSAHEGDEAGVLLRPIRVFGETTEQESEGR